MMFGHSQLCLKSESSTNKWEGFSRQAIMADQGKQQSIKTQNRKHDTTLVDMMFDIISSINAHVYVDVLDTFLITSIGKTFGDDDIICQDDNASSQSAKYVKIFLGLMSWPASNADLNPIDNLWWML